MCYWTLTLVAGLLVHQANPPSPDDCCLTCGQVQDLKAAGVTVITLTDLSQCLVTSATVEINDILFIRDQTVGLSKKKTDPRLLHIQWGAVGKAIKGGVPIRLVHDGKTFEGDDMERFRELIKPSDVVILVMRYDLKMKTCVLTQIRVLSIEKIKSHNPKGKN
jgi:hypothetical protein